MWRRGRAGGTRESGLWDLITRRGKWSEGELERDVVREHDEERGAIGNTLGRRELF